LQYLTRHCATRTHYFC